MGFCVLLGVRDLVLLEVSAEDAASAKGEDHILVMMQYLSRGDFSSTGSVLTSSSSSLPPSSNRQFRFE